MAAKVKRTKKLVKKKTIKKKPAAKKTAKKKALTPQERIEARNKRPFTPQQVAEDLGISVIYVRVLLNKLEISKDGGRWRWNKKEFDALCRKLKKHIKRAV